MVALTESLHQCFLEALDPSASWHSPIASKPLEVDLVRPLPPRLRCYVYSLVAGGSKRPNEFKGVLRVPGQAVGSYGSFDFSNNRFALVIAYHRDLDVWVMWDPVLHPTFKNGGNIQVRRETVLDAAASGRAEQRRRLASGSIELILCGRSAFVAEMVQERVATSGMSPDDG